MSLPNELLIVFSEFDAFFYCMIDIFTAFTSELDAFFYCMIDIFIAIT